MTSESKILTVSYGTFSCTLEGFDNPFDTMKVIAEYFRDLAANDRYFGAEPPQPDAAMLHRVAEREVARMVENRVAEGDAAAPAPEQPAPDLEADAFVFAPTASSTTEAIAEPALAAGMMPSAPLGAPKPVEPSLQDEVPKGFSAKLARIRASAAPSPATPPLPEDQLQAFMPTPPDGVGVSDTVSRFDALIQAPEEPEAFPNDAEGLAEDQSPVSAEFAAEAFEDSAPMAIEVDPDDIEPELAASPDFEVEQHIASADNLATDVLQVSDPEVSDQIADTGDLPFAEDLAPETALLDASEEALAISGSPVFYRFDDDSDLASDPIPAEAVRAEEPDVEELAPQSEMSQATAPADFAEDQAEVAFDVQPAAEMQDAAMDGATDLDPPALDVAEAAADQAGMAELQSEDEAPSQTIDDIVAPASGKGSGRYDRISSRVVRIRAEEPDMPVPEAESAPDPNATRIVRDGGTDSEMSRLLRQAEDVMSDDDNRRRLDSIALLKASVAETESDLGPSIEPRKTDDDRQDPYRDDLAKVVEPMPAPEPETPKPVRRKTRSVRVPDSRPGTIRPNAFGPPPLVLITEQRIDRPPPPLAPPPFVAATEPAAEMPAAREGQPMVALRTGRLTGAIGLGSAAPLSIAPHQKIVLEQPYQAGQTDADEDEDLDEALSAELESRLIRFAEQLGISSTVELLEAAAAFTTCVEDRSQFTRPQLMRRLMASAERGSISREDGLRSFGTLLRTGRIEKIGRGNYCLSQKSPFLNEARRFS